MEIPGTNTTTTNKYYWSIINGRFARRVKEGGIQRTTKTGKVVNEEYVDSIEGILLSVAVNSSEYGDDVCVTLSPVPGYTHIINLPKGSRFANSFIERLPLLKKGDSVKLTPYSFENQGGKKVTGISVLMNGMKTESFFKELIDGKYSYTNGYPPFPDDWQKLSEKQKKIYFLEVDEFLSSKLDEWIQKEA